MVNERRWKSYRSTSFDSWGEGMVGQDLLEEIRKFPHRKAVSHCGVQFGVSPFDFYFACPTCGQQMKLRGFSGVVEVQDVFDAVFAWLMEPGAMDLAKKQQEIFSREREEDASE